MHNLISHPNNIRPCTAAAVFSSDVSGFFPLRIMYVFKRVKTIS